jgi:AraC-like DNA-binding protein
LDILRALGLAGVAVLRAEAVGRDFARHAHRTFCLGVSLAGGRSISGSEGECRVAPGQVFLLNPGQPHACAPLGSAQDYALLAVEPALLDGLAGGKPWFVRRKADDPALAGLIQAAVKDMAGSDPARQQAALRAALACALAGHAEDRPAARPAEPDTVRRAREHMAARPGEPLPLAQVAAASLSSPFHLHRSFTAALGQTPHAYLLRCRVEAARRLLDQDVAIGQAALDAGFCDQGHLTRHFTRLLGLTPGEYRRGRYGPRR